jgi:hypothetical protein
MTRKRIRLPKEGLAGPEDRSGSSDFIDGTTDVQGHSWTNPAQPVDFSRRTPTNGGELEPTETRDDAAGPPLR